MVAIGVAGWLVCSFVAYGLTLGGFTYHFPYMNNLRESLLFPIFGPFTIFAVVGVLGCHWRLRPISKEERWKIFHEEHYCLSETYFERNHG